MVFSFKGRGPLRPLCFIREEGKPPFRAVPAAINIITRCNGSTAGCCFHKVKTAEAPFQSFLFVHKILFTAVLLMQNCKRTVNQVMSVRQIHPVRLAPFRTVPLHRSGQSPCTERDSTSAPNGAVPLHRTRYVPAPEQGESAIRFLLVHRRARIVVYKFSQLF